MTEDFAGELELLAREIADHSRERRRKPMKEHETPSGFTPEQMREMALWLELQPHGVLGAEMLRLAAADLDTLRGELEEVKAELADTFAADNLEILRADSAEAECDHLRGELAQAKAANVKLSEAVAVSAQRTLNAKAEFERLRDTGR